jgi:hypothetical protein
MLRFLVGLFMVLHGLVHLLYLGQSQRWFELQPGMVWPAGAWALTRLAGEAGTRWLASVACGLAAAGFVVGGIAILAGQPWWRPMVVGAAAFSIGIWLLFWDGGVQHLANKGAIAVLINGAILLAVLALRWPDLGF